MSWRVLWYVVLPQAARELKWWLIDLTDLKTPRSLT